MAQKKVLNILRSHVNSLKITKMRKMTFFANIGWHRQKTEYKVSILY